VSVTALYAAALGLFVT